LVGDSDGIVPMSKEQIGNLVEEILVDLQSDGHNSTSLCAGRAVASAASAAANLKAAITSSIVSYGHDWMTRFGGYPSAMVPTITLTGTRVPLMHGLPWWIRGSMLILSRQFMAGKLTPG
jgi:hypothetical protein